MSGRIIAAGGHLHGGGRSVDLVNESCGGRTLVHSHAWYGTKDSAFYKVRPILHEASPIRIGIEQSATGIPVSAGDRVALVGTYESSRLHTRVMNILLGYMSREPVPQCAPRPSDVVVTNKPKRYRRGVPRYDVPLVKQPPGAFKTLAGRAVPVGDDYFGLGRITVAAGTPVTWRFEGAELHSVTVANGPRGFSSPWTGNGGSFTFAPKVRGTYRIFCSLHPAAMTQELRVR